MKLFALGIPVDIKSCSDILKKSSAWEKNGSLNIDPNPLVPLVDEISLPNPPLWFENGLENPNLWKSSSSSNPKFLKKFSKISFACEKVKKSL